MRQESTPHNTGAEGIYSAPAEALAHARAVLARQDATSTERARALLVLGRAAQYGNRIADAVRLLSEARQLAVEPALVTEILLTLAPVLSKEGHPDEALALLDRSDLELGRGHAGQLRNQRGVILLEMGRLHEARDQATDAVHLLHEAGDQNREARAMANLAVIAALMGHLDDAEHWYAQALEMAVTTEQHVVAAGIEGNLGDLASRRGDFAAALRWYELARARFEKIGNVELLVSVLELDHARTLLDVGLLVDAAEAAQRSARLAGEGAHQMLETQAQLVLAEALVRLNDRRGARQAIERGATLARQVGQEAWQLRAMQLTADLDPSHRLNRGDVEEQLQRFLRSGWAREAFAYGLGQAMARRTSDPEGARHLLALVSRSTIGVDVDPLDRSVCALLQASLDHDVDAARSAFDEALDALHRQRDLLGSAELRRVIVERAQPIQELALGLALEAEDRAPAVLEVLERVRGVQATAASRPGSLAGHDAALVRLRHLRVQVAEAKITGGDPSARAAELRTAEHELLRSRRTEGARPTAPAADPRPGPRRLPADTVYITYSVHAGQVMAVVHTTSATVLRDVGPLDGIGPAVRSQRSALRWLASGGPPQHVPDQTARLLDASRALDQLLVQPLDLDPQARVVMTVPTTLRDVTWAALPSLQRRPLTFTPTLASWLAGTDPLAVERLALLSGPDLAAAADELARIRSMWNQPARADAETTCSEALAALRSADLVHIAAHGSFRTDNPFFSSLVFADGELSLLEMGALERVPSIVVLASCDAGATAVARRSDGDVVIGTAVELRSLGARAVLAPSAIVQDSAAADYAVLVHRALVDRMPMDDAVLGARLSMLDRGEPACMAAAVSFQLLGDQATRLPLRQTSSGIEIP